LKPETKPETRNRLPNWCLL